MAYLGNKKGPRESIIVDELGHEFFGITPAQLDNDVRDYRYGEARGVIMPVHIDEMGRPYIILSSKHGPVPFYLDGKHALSGEIQTCSPEDQDRWNYRQTCRS